MNSVQCQNFESQQRRLGVHRQLEYEILISKCALGKKGQQREYFPLVFAGGDGSAPELVAQVFERFVLLTLVDRDWQLGVQNRGDWPADCVERAFRYTPEQHRRRTIVEHEFLHLYLIIIKTRDSLVTLSFSVGKRWQVTVYEVRETQICEKKLSTSQDSQFNSQAVLIQ